MSVVNVLEFRFTLKASSRLFLMICGLLSSTQNESQGESDPKSACFPSLIIKLVELGSSFINIDFV